MKENQNSDAHWTVYKITGPDGKVYIGQTGEPLKARWRKGYHLSGPSRKGAIKEAMLKFGKENFRMEALCTNLTQEGAWALEAWFIDYYDSMNPEKGYNNKTGGPDKGCKMLFSPDYRKSVSEGVLRWYRENPDSKKKISENMKRRCAEGKNDFFIYSDNRPRPVICVETGVRYSSQAEAERLTGFNKIHNVCHGKQVTAGGYHWRFAEE